MNLVWKVNRLFAMGVSEIAHRVARALRANLERVGVGVARPARPRGVSGRSWVDSIPQFFESSTYSSAADEILSGKFNVFAMRGADLGFPAPWNRDPKTGKVAPLDFGKSLDYRDESIVGDIKYLWEPNRHLELVTLAQAWHLTGESRYALGCRSMVDSWIAACPYLRGPNWTSSLELGVRLVNWAIAWHLLGADRATIFEGDEGREFKRRWMTAIYQHCHFVAHHLSLYSSANNHIIGELAGLFIGSLTWPYWQDCEGWVREAQVGLERELDQQTFADGVNKEQAIWYQHEVADMALLAGLVGRKNSCEFSAAYWRQLESMLEFIASIMDFGGNVPAIGDSDDGVLVRWFPSEALSVYQSLLATGAVAFDRGDFKTKAKCYDDKSRWLLGDSAAERFANLRNDPTRLPIRRAFERGGYYILGSEFETSREVRIVADAGRLGYLSIAAHGHADALSITLSMGGRELLIDSGTFAYHTHKGWRDYFRGTSSHNTLRLDGQAQAISGGNFLWTKHVVAKALTFDCDSRRDRLCAEHDGYLRLADPVRTLRELDYHRASRTLAVHDRLICRGQHRVEMFWHFCESCLVTQDGSQVFARNQEASLTIAWPPEFTAHLVCGQSNPPLGWSSRRFDQKVPCHTLVVAGDISGSWDGITTISMLQFKT